jgi:hypothetical protein
MTNLVRQPKIIQNAESMLNVKCSMRGVIESNSESPGGSRERGATKHRININPRNSHPLKNNSHYRIAFRSSRSV